MTAQHPGLREWAAHVAPLLRAIAKNARRAGLDAVSMRVELTDRMHPRMSPDSLKRNWNRWLAGAETCSPLPSIQVLITLSRAARNLELLNPDSIGDDGARAFAAWLQRQDVVTTEKRLKDAIQLVENFVHRHLGDHVIYDTDALEVLPALLGTFASALATRISSPERYWLGNSCIARDAGMEGAKAVLAPMLELAAKLEVAEAALGILPIPEGSKALPLSSAEMRQISEGEAARMVAELSKQPPIGRFFKQRTVKGR